MLIVRTYNCPEIIYTVRVILEEFLGLNISIEHRQDVSAKDVEIVLDNGKKIVFKDTFFSKYNYDGDYLEKDAVPGNISWLTTDYFTERVPLIFGKPEIESSDNTIISRADLLSSAFFMLSRWEEVVVEKKDVHERFPVTQSLAYKEKFLHKPVVNQYTEVIWNMLTRLGCGEKRKEFSFNIEVSHDVDIPFKYAGMTLLNLFRLAGGDILKRRSFFKAAQNLYRYFLVKIGNIEKDPYNNFEYIMDISEEINLKSTFFFISEKTDMQYDGTYCINDSKIKNLLGSIDKRGHRIGLHGSYNSYNSNQLKGELDKLSKTCSESGVKQDIHYSRQHFLRWQTPDTFQKLEDAGIKYDSTLTFAGQPGFRCGSCYPYSVFNVRTRQTLKLIEIPLIVMDASLLAEKYLNLSAEDALDVALSLKNECRRYNGVFSVLWHNNEFDTKEKRSLYLNILRG